ncbi:hypothetical protein [Paraburkholderia fungorum]|uniref:hypothetical protein n=1 Tax=Paraburkholderia fungorum TaxID=134537 RepID=UPI0011C4A506|nr:hypothetical protein [Paraburkholderia fungorum]
MKFRSRLSAFTGGPDRSSTCDLPDAVLIVRRGKSFWPGISLLRFLWKFQGKNFPDHDDYAKTPGTSAKFVMKISMR